MRKKAKYVVIGFQYRLSIDGKEWGDWFIPQGYPNPNIDRKAFEERFDFNLFNLKNGTLQIRNIYAKEGEGES
jgi:hypothetical protein